MIKFISFVASSPDVKNGGSFLLSWNVTGAESLTLQSSDGSAGSPTDIAPPSQPFVKPSLTVSPIAFDRVVTYTLKATDSDGTVATESVKVNVGAAKPVPVVRRIYTAAGLPPGMVMSQDGLLSGTPTVPGKYVIDVKMIDSDGNTLESKTELVVNPAGGTLTMSPATLPPAVQGVPVSIKFDTEAK